LRNPNILEVDFINMDIIESLIEEDSVQTNSVQAVEKQLTTWQRFLKKHPNFIKSLKDVHKGKPNKFRGLSWYSNVAVGVINIGYPLNLNSNITYKDSNGNTTNQDSVASSQRTGGYGLAGGAQLWPFFGNYVGLGFFGTVSMGGTPSLYSFFNLDYGARAYLGDKNVKLIFEYSKAIRYGTYFEEFQKQFTNGSTHETSIGIADFQLRRFGIGPRITFDTQIPLVLDFQFFFDKPIGLLTNKKQIFTWKMTWWLHNYFQFGVELSTNYPVAGNILYPKSPDYSDNSSYLLISLAKPFDFFGKPYYAKKKKRK